MRKLSYIIGLGILFGCWACNDILDMDPENSVTFSNAMQTEREIEVGLGTIEKKIRDYSQDNQRIKPARAGRFASKLLINRILTLCVIGVIFIRLLLRLILFCLISIR